MPVFWLKYLCFCNALCTELPSWPLGRGRERDGIHLRATFALDSHMHCYNRYYTSALRAHFLTSCPPAVNSTVRPTAPPSLVWIVLRSVSRRRAPPCLPAAPPLRQPHALVTLRLWLADERWNARSFPLHRAPTHSCCCTPPSQDLYPSQISTTPRWSCSAKSNNSKFMESIFSECFFLSAESTFGCKRQTVHARGSGPPGQQESSL